MNIRTTVTYTLAMLLAALYGCRGENTPTDPTAEKREPGVGVDTHSEASSLEKAIPVRLPDGAQWCDEHGVPESHCTRCDPSLIPKYKQAGDWCAGHDLPESQCFICNPTFAAKWKALQPKESHDGDDLNAAGATSHGAHAEKFIPDKLPAGAAWCSEHGVPESHCTRCDPSLVPKFKKDGDWCAGHDLPESQCLTCNPGFAAKWRALAPEDRIQFSAGQAGNLRLEPNRRVLAASNDPLCQVDRLQIRFKDPSIQEKAGIKTEAVALRRISAVVECPGEVAYDQNRLAHVTPRVKGVIARSVAELGSTVEMGDLLAVIDSPALGEAKSRYIELREKHQLAKADFERAKLIHTGVQQILDLCETMTSAEEIRKKFTEVRIGEAKSRLLKSHADLELARANFERESRLREQKISSEQAFETARGNLHAAEAQFHAAHEEIAFTAERDYLLADRMLHIAQNALDVAERQLHILGVDEGAVAALETTPDTALLAYELRSPLSGRVVERHAVVGESVDEKDALYTVADLSTVWLMLDVPERELIELRIGLLVLFTVDGLPGNSFQGTLTWISSQVDDRTRTVKARAELPNDPGLLRANMFGRARVVLHDNEEVPTIPDEAVQTDGCCQLVFVKEDDALYRPRKVALGAAANGYVEIHKGLQIGEIVVTAGSFLMKTEILKSNIGAGCCEVDPGR